MKTKSSYMALLALWLAALLPGAPAGAATVVNWSLTGNWIGAAGSCSVACIIETPYWAGIVELDIDGGRYWGMSPFMTSPADLMDASPANTGTLYTRDDMLASWDTATNEYLARSATILWFALTTTGVTNLPLWFAGNNEMVLQQFLDRIGLPADDPLREDLLDNANLCYFTSIEPCGTLHEVYDVVYTDYMNPNLDYSSFMSVLDDPYGGFLVYTSAVPVPPALWLFGSGLIGLIAAARRRVG